MKIVKKITHRDEESINKYFTDLKKYKLLTVDEELKLIESYKKNKDIKSRNKLVESNALFVISCAKSYQENSSKLLLGDIIGYGNIGLCNAIEKFEPNKGFKFITYAVWHIKQQIIIGLQNNQTILNTPNNYPSVIQKVIKESDKFLTKYQRLPELVELIDNGIILDYEANIYKESHYFNNLIKLDDEIDENYKNIDIIDSKSDYYNVNNYFDKKHNEFIVNRLINNKKLKQIEKEIISKFFGINCEKESIDTLCEKYSYTKQTFNLTIRKIMKKMSNCKID